MIRLIKAELKKIFHKKSFYIVTIIFVFYAILTNFIYKSMSNYNYDEQINIEEYKEINSKLDLTNEENIYEYITNLTIIETEELKKDCTNSNCKYVIENFIYNLLTEAYQEKYINQSEEEYLALMNKYDIYKRELKQNNWKYFTNLKIEELENSLVSQKDTLTIERYKETIALEKYRLEKNIDYSENYLNEAILSLEENLFEYYNLKNKDNLSKEELERFYYLEENYLTNHYVLDNEKDVNNTTNLNSVLKNFTSEFGLFILIYVVMLSGSIVSEEFNKGTIKYLLTKPYKRSTILSSKILTVLLLIPLIILTMLLLETIIGGIILGFSSLNIPVIIYSTSAHQLIETSIFTYLIQNIICNLPIYIVLGVLCFMLSTVTSSTSAAITITFLFYLASNVIANLALYYPIKIFKAFVSLHWDFSYLVNHTHHPYNIATWVSLLVVAIYIIVMLCIAYAYFTKKDVKNI